MVYISWLKGIFSSCAGEEITDWMLSWLMMYSGLYHQPAQATGSIRYFSKDILLNIDNALGTLRIGKK